jgi:hypothetical protein
MINLPIIGLIDGIYPKIRPRERQRVYVVECCGMLWNSGGMVVEGGPIFDYVQQFNYVQPLVIGIVECC